MRRVWKWSVRTVVASLVLVALLAAALLLLLNTEKGTRWVLQSIDASLSGELVTTDVQGTLWQGLQLSSLSYSVSGRVIRATDVTLRIDWTGIVAAKIALQEVRAATLDISTRPTDQRNPLTVSMPPLRVAIAVAHGEIDRFTFSGNSAPQLFENIVFDVASLQGSTIRVRRLAAAGSGVNASAQRVRLTLAGDAPAAAQVAWSLADRDWSGQGAVQGSLTQLAFEQTVAGPYPFTAVGNVRLLQQIEPQYDVTINWDNWAVSDYRVLDGTVRVQGAINQYHAEYAATAVLPGEQQLQVTGSGRGNLQQLEEFTAQVESEFGQASLDGTVAWLPTFVVAADVQVSGIDPGDLAEPLSGELTASAFVTANDRGAAAIAGLAVSGVLNGAPIQAQGDIRLAPQQIQCAACALLVGKNQLRINGHTSAGQLALAAFIDAPDLRQLWPGIAGSARGEGRLQGPIGQPQFTGLLEMQSPEFGAWVARSIAIDSKDSTLDAVDVRVHIADLQNGATDYGTITLRGRGLPANLQLDIGWQVLGIRLDADGTLQATDSGLIGRIEHANINEPQTGDWRLQNAFSLRYAERAFSIEPQLWTGASGNLQLGRFGVSDEQIDIAASIDNFPLHVADSFLPAGFHLQGEAAGSIDVARRADVWTGSFEWQQRDTLLRVATGPEQSAEVRVSRAELQANFRDGGVAATAAMAIEPGVSSELEMQLSSLDSTARLQARLHFQGDDWSWISAVVPDVDGVRGNIEASINASGPLLTPELSGDLVWRDGRLLLPALNVPLNDINLVVSGAPQGAATLRGSAKAGDGTVAVSGSIDKLLQAARSMTLKVTGESAELIDWPEYHVWGSPDITIVGDAEGWRVSGDLQITRADIEIREIPVEATTVSADVVVIGAEDAPDTATRIAGQVRVSLGKRVRVKALGLDTGLSGEAIVRRRPDRQVTAEGRISLVDGSFSTQGQKLTIRNGDLTFTGPLDNPIVDVRAVRVIETLDSKVTAGIYLHGRALDLTSTVFSEPAMNDVDALSYLVIGRPLNQATDAEGGELSGAAVSMGLRQATRLTEQIGQTLGLDQLSLTGDGGDTTALIAGKKINSRLYARYAYGVFSRLGTLLMRYKLSERLTLEAGAGEAQSIDILYSVEQH